MAAGARKCWFLLLFLPQIVLAALSFQQVILDNSYFAYERDVGDIDGDGDNDVVTIQEGDTNLQVFRAPTWARSTLLSFTGTYRYPRADDFKLADIDGDGDVDVVTRLGAGPTDDGLGIAVWYENLGGGSTFTQHLIGNSPTYVKDIVVADFDRDGRLDVAMRMDSQTQLWLQNSNGSWSEVLLSHPSHEGMEVGDLDMDGDPDLILNGFWFATPNTPATARVAANYIQKTIDTAWWNQGGDWTADSCKVVVGDFDGDGANDVAFSHSERSGYAVAWYGSANPNGAGPWVKHSVTVVDYCHNLQAADFNLDGKVDLLVGGMIQSQHRGLKLMLNNGTGTSWSEFVIQTDGSYSAELGDIDKDGDLDIVGIRNWDSGPTYIYRNSASGGDTTRPTITSVTATSTNSVNVLFSEPVATTSAQTAGNYSINNGVTISGAVLGTDTRTVTLTTSALAGGGGGTSLEFWTYKQVTAAHTRTFSLCFPDVDGDGDLDIASGRYVYRNPGSPMTGTWTQTALPGSAHAFVTVNVDGDNLIDLIAQQDNVSGGRIDIYWIEAANTTATSWSAPILIGNVPRGIEPEGFQGYAIAQIVAGGLPEVIVNSPQGLYYFSIPSSNPGAGNWPRTLVAANNSEEGIGVADIDGDGDLDISFSSGNVNEVKWARNPGNGTGSWSVFVIGTFPEADWPDRCAAADLNGDGRMDIIVTEENAGGSPDALACWWEQPAGGATSANWVRHTITTQYTMNSMDVGDVDKDGDIDIVLAEHRGTKRIAVWANNGQGSFTEHLVDTGKESHLGARLVDLDGDGGLDLVSIAYDTPNTLHLWRNDNPASSGGTYTLTVNNVSDRATPPNPILPNSQTSFSFAPGGDTTRPTITSVTAVNATSVQVLFSELVTAASAQASANYGINNGVTISGAVLGADTRTVTLTTSALAGGSYTLTVNNVTDRATPSNTIVANSQTAFSFTPAADTTPPTTPGNLTGTGTSTNTVQLAWQASSDNVGVTEYRISRNGTLAATLPGTQTSYQDIGLTATTTYAYSVVARDAVGNTSPAATVSATTQAGGGSTAVVRVNAGGGTFVDAAGNNWSADFGFNTGATYSNPSAISGTVNDGLYQSERYDVSSSPELAYSFNLPNGDYTVNLHFAEIFSGAAHTGGRIFDVWVEGQSRIASLDIFSRVGVNTALIISLPVTVSDGQLNIAFVHGVENPKIAAIEVLAPVAIQQSLAVGAPMAPYQQWRRVHFAPAELADPVLSGDAGDPDADRINNLMEYALGLDPKVADMEGRPVAQIENGLLALTHTRNIAATDVLLIVEAAEQLSGSWSGVGLMPQVINDDGAIQTVKVTDSVAVGTAKSRFLRLTVQLR